MEDTESLLNVLAEAMIATSKRQQSLALQKAKRHGWVVSAIKVSGGLLMMRKGGGKPAAVLTSKGRVVRCPWKGATP